MDFHVFHASHRFGLFPHVFHEFFVPFFVPAEREKKAGFHGAILAIQDSWAMGKRRQMASGPQMPLRGGAPPNGKRPVVGFLDAQEVVMTAALVRVMAFRQEQERALRGPGDLFRRMAA